MLGPQIIDALIAHSSFSLIYSIKNETKRILANIQSYEKIEATWLERIYYKAVVIKTLVYVSQE